MFGEISPQEFNRIHEAAIEIDKLRDHAQIEQELGMERQAAPMAGDQYWDQVHFEEADRGQATIKEIESTIPARPARPSRPSRESSEEPKCETDQLRNSLIRSAPEFTDLIQARDAVVNAYCESKGISKDEISMDQLLEIRALPEWQNPFGQQ
jgi:hypothetical protein